MTKARQLADLLDASGDVSVGALDNVPPSNDASALTTGTLPVDRVPYVGRRNLIINGGFDVWQRGTSWTSATNGQYTVDRWQTFGASMTCNIDRSTDVPSNQGFKYSVKVVRTANGLPFLRQVIEDFDTVVTGRDWTASFWAKADTACTISVDLGDTGSTTVSIGTSWEKHTVYFPSTLTPTYTALDFQSNSSDTPMYFTGVQLELGSVATPFEHRSYGEELALCQRYYNNYGRVFRVEYNSSYSGWRYFDGIEFPKMRATPSVTYTCTQAYPSVDPATVVVGSEYVREDALGWRQTGGSQANLYSFVITLDAEL